MSLKNILDIDQMGKVVWYLALFSISVSTLFVSAYYFYDDKIVLFTKESFQYEQRMTFSNESNSMGLTMKHGDIALVQEVSKNEFLKIGSIYAFEDQNKDLVSHRITYCFTIKDNEPIQDLYCKEHIILKGDNNKIGELVHREQIKYHIRGLVYE